MELILIVFLYLILLLILKPKFNTLNCGIFGWVGKDPKKFNKDKFDKLGIYNVARGKDSCGVSVDGDIKVGVGFNEKNYTDFIIKHNDIIPKKYPVVIGHTRQASVGNVVNESNAHPFGFGMNEAGESYEFIGCHNGTLYNHTELAKKYDIDEYEKKVERSSTGGFITSSRKKIDSEILLEIIYTHKNFKVLNEYTGAAALMFTNTNEPNKVYIWKGASKMYSYSNFKADEERPLFYYIENKNSLYISSLEDSLVTIGGVSDKTIFSFDNNTLYTITDGDIFKAEKIIISRETSTQKESVTTTHNYSRHGYMNDYYDEEPKSNFVNKTVADYVTSKVVNLNIYNEGLIRNQNEYGKKVYFTKLRYYQKGHLIKGIYTFILGYGFYKLTESSEMLDAMQEMRKLINIPFRNNDFDYSLGVETIKNGNYYIPFKTTQIQNIHYFVEGVKIRTHLDFKIIYNEKEALEKGQYLDHIKLSYVSCNPVIDISVDTKHEHTQGIVYNGKLVNDTICPMGSEKIYTIDFGNLKKTILTTYFNISTTFNMSNNLKEKYNQKIKERNERLALERQKEIDDQEKDDVYLLDISEPESKIEEKETLIEFDNLEALSGEYELISENLNEAMNGINSHIENLKSFEKDPEVMKKITDLKFLKDQMSIILETE